MLSNSGTVCFPFSTPLFFYWSFYLSSVSSTSRTSTPGVHSRGSSQLWWPPRCHRGTQIQDPSVEATHGTETLVQGPMPEAELGTRADVALSLAMGEVAVGSSAGLMGPFAGAPSSLPQMGIVTALVGADDATIEEPEVVLGHPTLRASGDVSLSEAMGTAHWVL
jgi:hypothetical protein